MSSYVMIPYEILAMECERATSQLLASRSKKIESFFHERVKKWNFWRSWLGISTKWDIEKVRQFYGKRSSLTTEEFRDYSFYASFGWEDLKILEHLRSLAVQSHAFTVVSKNHEYKGGVLISGEDLSVLRAWAKGQNAKATVHRQRQDIKIQKTKP